MYIVVETWTPEQAFLAASPQERAEFFDGLRAGTARSAAQGVRPLGWGRTDPAGEHGGEHDWFAVWQMPGPAAADAFLAEVAASGWYGYFEQTNTRGRLRPPGDVIDEHVGLVR